MVTFIGVRLALADIQFPFHNGRIEREIYVRPALEWSFSCGMLWSLTKLPYGIVEVRIQWIKTVEHWTLNVSGLERILGLKQIYVLRDSCGKFVLIDAKVIDDFVCGGAIQAMKSFTKELKKMLEVGKIAIICRFHFNGCEIWKVAEGSIRISMESYMNVIMELPLARERRKQLCENATESQITQFRSRCCGWEKDSCHQQIIKGQRCSKDCDS